MQRTGWRFDEFVEEHGDRLNRSLYLRTDSWETATRLLRRALARCYRRRRRVGVRLDPLRYVETELVAATPNVDGARSAAVLHYWDGLSVRQLARLLDRPQAAVATDAEAGLASYGVTDPAAAASTLDAASTGGPPAPTGREVRRRVAAVRVASVGAVAAIAAGAIVVTGVIGGDDGPARPAARRTSVGPHLPAGVAPLPDVVPQDQSLFGVIRLVPPSQRLISRTRAFHAYDSLLGGVERVAGRRVMTAVVRALYVDGEVIRPGTFWIVSVWYHPLFSPHQWCVAHGVIDAQSGEPLFGRTLANCPLPPGYSPEPVT